MKNWFTKKDRLLAGTIIAGASVMGLGGPAMAQDEAATSTSEDEIIVTGSRIARQDFIANSPIVTVGQEQIQATGVTTLDTLLNEMPQFVPGINMTSNNPSNGGQANLQLRGLGAARTLVLMDGRRVVPSNSTGTVDINIIPAQLVESIEVVTGGASATYGSDAIGGVVNFKLRHDLQGFEIDGAYGVTDRDDGYVHSYSVATGGDFDEGRGSALLMMSYNYRGDIYNASRQFSSISGPSAASPLGNTVFDATNLPTAGAVTAAVPGSLNTQTFGFNNDGSLFSYTGRNQLISPGGIDFDGFTQPGPFFNPDFAYNTGPLNLLTLPQTRYNAFAHVDYEISENFEVYSDFLFTQYESYQELAASPAAAGTGFRVPRHNPFITPELASVLDSRPNPNASFRLDKRFTALGPRRGAELYDVYQITTGLRGDLGIAEDITYDIFASYGRVDRTTVQTGNVSRGAVQTLLNDIYGGMGDEAFDPTLDVDTVNEAGPGGAVCAGGFNWFGETELSAECQNFIGRTSKNLIIQDQRNVEASIQGGLFELPAGELRFALGSSYREDSFELIPDGSLSALLTVQPCTFVPGPPPACTPSTPALSGNDIAGFNPSAPLEGSTSVVEYFGEVLIPLIKEVPLIEELNVTLAGRYSDYNTVGGVSTYKGDVDWTVVPGLRLRGGYQQAIRAPSVGELFGPQLLNFPNIGNPTASGAPALSGDPCDVRSGFRSTAGSNQAAGTNADVEALCLAQGLPAAVLETYTFTNQQVPGFVGGNPDLTEETAKTYSIGAVFSPNIDHPLFEQLTATIDYYSIEVIDAVGTISAANMIQACYNRNGQNPTYDANNFFCQLFERDPLSGNIRNALSINFNLGELTTSGVDFQVNWGFDVGPGSLGLTFVGTYLENFEILNVPDFPIDDRTGTIGNGIALSFPKWKWLAAADYDIGAYSLGLRWRHIGEQVDFLNQNDEIPAIGYIDVLAGWDVTDNISLRFNVNNIADEQPPTYANSVQANTDPSTFDVLGRRFTIGFTGRF